MRKQLNIIRKLLAKLGKRGVTLGETVAGMAATAVSGALIFSVVSTGLTTTEIKIQVANQLGMARSAKSLLVDKKVFMNAGDSIFVSLADLGIKITLTDPSNKNSGYDTSESGVLLENNNGNFVAYTQLKKAGSNYCYISQITTKNRTADK